MHSTIIVRIGRNYLSFETDGEELKYHYQFPCQPYRCYCCPLLLLRRLLTSSSPAKKFIPFRRRYNGHRDRYYGTSWDTAIYEEYSQTVIGGDIILVDLYYDGTAMSKAGTKDVTFLRIRLSIIRPHIEKWFTVAFVPTTTSIPSTLTE